MKLAFFVLAMALLFPVMAPAQDDPTARAVIEFIKPQDVFKLIQEKDTSFVLVDTQPEEAFQDEHIVGAVNYPWTDRPSFPIPLPRDKMLIFYCACNHDEDSISMVTKLASFGYLNTKVLEGGWFAWQKLRYPTAGDAVPKAGRQ